MTKRKSKPATVKDMARRRGLHIGKAVHGGWYVTILTTPDSPAPVLYASHLWNKIRQFVKKQPIMIKLAEQEDEDDN
jgi:hypothetical protein